VNISGGAYAMRTVGIFSSLFKGQKQTTHHSNVNENIETIFYVIYRKKTLGQLNYILFIIQNTIWANTNFLFFFLV